MIKLSAVIELLRPLALQITPRRPRCDVFQIALEQGLDRRRQIFVLVAHRRGFSGAAGMYGELTPAPNGLIDRRPGGIS